MSKLLREILKISILPACLMVVGKILGLLLAVRFYGFVAFVDNDNSLPLSSQIYFTNPNHTFLANSFSNVFVLAIFISIVAYLFAKAFALKSAQSNPRTIVKLTKVNLLKWVTGKDVSFLKIFVWVSFLWTNAAIIIAATLRAENAAWIGIIAFVTAIFSAWGLVRIFESETAKIFPNSESKFV